MVTVERRTDEELATDRRADSGNELSMSGWDVVRYCDNRREVVDWFADRYAAEQLAAELNEVPS